MRLERPSVTLYPGNSGSHTHLHSIRDSYESGLVGGHSVQKLLRTPSSTSGSVPALSGRDPGTVIRPPDPMDETKLMLAAPVLLLSCCYVVSQNLFDIPSICASFINHGLNNLAKLEYLMGCRNVAVVMMLVCVLMLTSCLNNRNNEKLLRDEEAQVDVHVKNRKLENAVAVALTDVGLAGLSCDSGESLIGNKCYRACDSGYSPDSAGTMCVQNCASGETSTATTCIIPQLDGSLFDCGFGCAGTFVSCSSVNGRSYYCVDDGYRFPVAKCHCRSAGSTYSRVTATRSWQCPAGSYSSLGSCIACSPGSYQSSEGQTSCVACAKGTYAPAAGASSYSTCPAGSTTPSLLVMEFSFDLETYDNDVSVANGGAIVTTDATLYNSPTISNDVRIVGSASIQLDDLSFSTAYGATACVLCPAGTYSSLGSCVACSPGSYQSSEGQTSCVACAKGTYASAAGASAYSTCPAGSTTPSLLVMEFSFDSSTVVRNGNRTFFVNTGAIVTAKAELYNYPSNFIFSSGDDLSFSTAYGATACVLCPAGTYSSLGSCVACSPGSYQSSEGQTSCVACAKGTYASAAGALAFSTCPAGSTTPSLLVMEFSFDSSTVVRNGNRTFFVNRGAIVTAKAEVYNFPNSSTYDAINLLSIQLAASANGLALSVYSGNEAANEDLNVISNVNNDVWRHFVWTLDPAGVWTVYVDGVVAWQ
eukprot:gene28469-37419_t